MARIGIKQIKIRTTPYGISLERGNFLKFLWAFIFAQGLFWSFAFLSVGDTQRAYILWQETELVIFYSILLILSFIVPMGRYRAEQFKLDRGEFCLTILKIPPFPNRKIQKEMSEIHGLTYIQKTQILEMYVGKKRIKFFQGISFTEGIAIIQYLLGQKMIHPKQVNEKTLKFIYV